MDYFLENWGSIVGVLGVIISTGGLVIAFIAMVRAGKAREAAAAAEEASNETRAAIIKSMTVVDLQRAIATIQRLKELHRDSRWDASIEHYRILRVMLGDIRDRYPALTARLFAGSQNPITRVVAMEDSVDRAIVERAAPSGVDEFNRILNSIQVELEEIARTIHQGEVR